MISNRVQRGEKRIRAGNYFNRITRVSVSSGAEPTLSLTILFDLP